jgi:hypothetical protein
MKFNLLCSTTLLGGITLLMMSTSISKLEAQNVNQNKVTPVAPSNTEVLQSISSSTQGQVAKESTVATLTAHTNSKAVTLGKSVTLISQIVSPTDSNGNRIFRSTRSGPSYLGVGANFGVSGGSDLGGTSFAVISKLGLTETFSVRPSVLILHDFATILLPVSYDFAPQQPFGDFQFSPYLGGGVAINTGSNSSVGPMITAGVDIPLSSQFTINVAANLAFLRTTDLGILVGIGYNF